MAFRRNLIPMISPECCKNIPIKNYILTKHAPSQPISFGFAFQTKRANSTESKAAPIQNQLMYVKS